MNPYDYLQVASRNSVLELTLSLTEVFDYLGLGALNSYEIKLIERKETTTLTITSCPCHITNTLETEH